MPVDIHQNWNSQKYLKGTLVLDNIIILSCWCVWVKPLNVRFATRGCFVDTCPVAVTGTFSRPALLHSTNLDTNTHIHTYTYKDCLPSV